MNVEPADVVGRSLPGDGVTTDARGLPARITQPHAIEEALRKRAGDTTAEARFRKALRERAGRPFYGLALLLTAMLAPVLLGWTFVAWMLAAWAGKPLLGVALSVVALPVAVVVVFRAFAGRPTPEAVAAAALSAATCPQCLYSLIGVRAAPDGCTVCPECGAAWLMPHSQPPPPTP